LRKGEKMLKTRAIAFIAIMAFCAIGLACITVVHADQSTTTTTTVTLTWEEVSEYLFIGALAGIIHDVNDKNGVIILPKQLLDANGKPTGQWDLGVISPALFGGAAGAIALYVGTTPVVSTFFPNITGPVPGGLSAFIGGYLWSKLFAVLSSGQQATVTAAAKAPS
jgi:hypothetical protein